ncbi:hypothetical protein R3P38DRAFT_3504638 [Favolaschia claudopus]|uniref:MYND-type domain-containing protein n=1 Tax=Favolaschia claudopus TaxID=2862362 RepID=A0AAV9Z355_9AGAR
MPGASLLTARELANIPLSLRPVAKAIADTSKPLETIATLLLDLSRRLHTRNYNGTLGSNFMPLVSALLDPARLPPESSDSPSSSTIFRDELLCASRAIFLFTCTPTTMRSHISTLWPRIWPWLQLMDNHDCFPAECEIACGRCLMLAAFEPLVQLPRSSAVKTLFMTPGFATFLVQMWKRILCCWTEDSAKRSSRGRANRSLSPPMLLTPFLRCCFEFPDILDELVEGAGGMDELAALIFQHIQLIHREGEVLLADEANMNLAVFGECVESMDVAKNFVDYLGHSTPSAWVALVGAGYFGFAADMFTSFATSTTNHPPRSVLAAQWQYLQHIIHLLPHVDSKRLVTAVECGFVLACRICGNNVFVNGIQTVEEFAPLDLVLGFVAQAACDYRSLCDMAHRLSLSMSVELNESPGNPDAPAIWTGWHEFKTLIQSRLQLVEEFNSKDFSSNRACWNIECPRLKVPKSELRKCACCHLALYCSTDCQKMSWKPYGHRNRCHPATQASKSDHRDTRFSLFLTLRDYQAHKVTILLQQLAYIKRTGDTEFCVVMQYTGGRCAPAVVALASKAEIWESHPSAAWDANEGHKELHVVRFDGGGGQWNQSGEISLALRRSTSAVLQGLVALAREIPQGVDVTQLATAQPALFERVGELAGLDVVETYDVAASGQRWVYLREDTTPHRRRIKKTLPDMQLLHIINLLWGSSSSTTPQSPPLTSGYDAAPPTYQENTSGYDSGGIRSKYKAPDGRIKSTAGSVPACDLRDMFCDSWYLLAKAHKQEYLQLLKQVQELLWVVVDLSLGAESSDFLPQSVLYNLGNFARFVFAVLNLPEIVDKYQHRYFVPCDAASTSRGNSNSPRKV